MRAARVWRTLVLMTTIDSELKARHRTMWGLGNYPSVAADVIADLGPTLVEAAGLAPGQRVLDVAAGSGNVAIPAARLGADVTASDLSPELLAEGETAANRLGVALGWEVADAENLPYADASFDAVVSCVGVMFAPHHQAAADELVRVTRPGGTIGLINWTPEGFVGQMFAVMKPYAPPPPPGASPPPLWGDETHLAGLLGDRVADLRMERRTLRVTRFATGAEFRDFFKATYGPTIVTYRAIADDAERVAELDAALAELGEKHLAASGVRGTMEWEYLLATARR